jgi:hypothetical protein
MSPRLLVPLALGGLLLAGCGGAAHRSAPAPSAATTTARPAGPTATPKPAKGASALQAEATATAAGDIPDNQVFLRFANAAGAYSIKYPEGWAQQGAGAKVTFRDKNNIVRIIVTKGPVPAASGIKSQLSSLPGARMVSGPDRLTLAGAPALKMVYSTESAPNAVTGKQVTLVVDRYYLAHAGKEAIVDLGTPRGVDNVDAYRLMVESFRWR